MDINRLTEKAQEALRAAHSEATRRGHQQIDVEHLLLSLLEQEGGLAGSILEKASVEPAAVRGRVEQELERLPKVSLPSGGAGEIYITPRLNRLLVQADTEARQLKDEYVSIEHVLLAMADERSGAAGRILGEAGLTRDRLMQALKGVRGSQRVTSQNPEATYEALERYGRDLTKLAATGKLDPVIGRDDEAAVEYGAWLVARTGARLSATHVIYARRLAGHFVRHFSEVLRDTHSPGLKFFKGYPVHLSTHYLVGNSLRAIRDHVEETRGDLPVMGAYADCTAESISLGSTTEYLMRNSPVPVLVHH